MQFKHVTLDFDGSVAILRLDHQEVMNAVSIDMLAGLGEALDAIDDSGRRCAASSSPAPDARSAPAPICRAVTTRSPARATPALRWKPRSIHSCAACATCIVRS